MHLIVAGFGFVGNAIYETFKNDFLLSIIDPKINDCKIPDFKNVDGVICCVSTPQDADGSCYVGNVLDVIHDTPENIPILIKSTISIQGYNIIKEQFPNHIITFSPEFLRADSAIDDMKRTSYIILSSGSGADFWEDVFRTRFKNLMVLEYPIEDCIAIKYFENSFLATKLSFYNEMYDFCNAYGLNYEIVRNGLGYDTRIGMSHTLVDPSAGFRGWGGHCFPKDTSALLKMAQIKSVGLNTLQAAVNYNNEIRNKQRP